jgi:hypothetical protein
MPRSQRRPVFSIEPNHGKTRKLLANPRLARLAFQLEACLTQSTILGNVFRHTTHPVNRDAELDAGKLFNSSARATGSWQTFQETLSTQWQKN